MKKTIIIIGIILFGILFGFLIRKLTTKSEIIDTHMEYLKQIDLKISKLGKQNTDLHIIDQTAYLGKDSLNIMDLHKMDSVLFFYFSQNTCSPCIAQTVSIIKNNTRAYEINPRIVFISPDSPIRLWDNCYGKKLLVLKHGKLGIPLEKENVPFLFTLDDSLSIKNLHIVNKNDFARTEKYIFNLAGKYNLNH